MHAQFIRCIRFLELRTWHCSIVHVVSFNSNNWFHLIFLLDVSDSFLLPRLKNVFRNELYPIFLSGTSDCSSSKFVLIRGPTLKGGYRSSLPGLGVPNVSKLCKKKCLSTQKKKKSSTFSFFHKASHLYVQICWRVGVCLHLLRLPPAPTYVPIVEDIDEKYPEQPYVAGEFKQVPDIRIKFYDHFLLFFCSFDQNQCSFFTLSEPHKMVQTTISSVTYSNTFRALALQERNQVSLRHVRFAYKQ